jgi:hypothetical protein
VRKLLKLNEAECSTPQALALFKTAHDHWTEVQVAYSEEFGSMVTCRSISS